jgi:hypothetical protein
MIWPLQKFQYLLEHKLNQQMKRFNYLSALSGISSIPNRGWFTSESINGQSY